MNGTVRRGGEFVLQSAAASAAMTASQRAEMAATGRAPSDLPVRAVERLTGVGVSGAGARTVVGHLAQGSLAAVGVAMARKTRKAPGLPAVAVIATTLVVGDAVLAAMVGLAQPPWRWARTDLAIDVMHKTSLAVAARAIVTRGPEW